MRCWRTRRVLSDYQANELPQEQVEQVEYHLVRCHKCLQLLKEYQAVSDLVVGAWKLKKQNLTREERYIISAKMQSDMSILRKPSPSLKAKISKWLRKMWGTFPSALAEGLSRLGLAHLRDEVRRMCLSPFMPGAVIVVFLIGAFVFLQFRHSTLLPVKVSISTPNAQIVAGGNTQLYRKPKEDGSTAVGVVYTYDTVSVLTKRSNINLTSGATAYVYPDGTISEPEQISEDQLKIWKGGKGTVPSALGGGTVRVLR